MNDEPNPAIRTASRTLRPIGSVVVRIITAIAIAACSSDHSDDPAAAATSVSQAATTSAPSPTSIPTTVAPATTVATESVSFAVESANDIAVTFIAPADWVVADGWSAYNDAASAGVIFDSITNIYAEGCQWVLVDPPVGPTVDDLVTAWANVPNVAATTAVDVTVDGYAGKQFEFTAPDYTASECRGTKYGLWDVPGTGGGDEPPGYWAQLPNQHLEMWVLDVDGTRLVIGASTSPSTPAQDRTALEELVASIQIG